MHNDNDRNSMIAKKDNERRPPPRTPAQEATWALGTLQSQAGDLSKALKALPKVEAYRSVWSKATTDAMKADTLKVVGQMEQELRRIRDLVEGTLREDA